jgi:DNA-binding IclR family transcriptional regulator
LQISASTITIKDEARKQIYLQILSDQFCMGIISSIIDEPKTAVEIAKTTNIPISTVYRRLQFLQENKMLKTSGGLNKDGKYFVYLSKLKAASTFFDGSEIWVSVTPNLNFTIN